MGHKPHISLRVNRVGAINDYEQQRLRVFEASWDGKMNVLMGKMVAQMVKGLTTEVR